jgi:ABC-type Fe3+-hydroxamate transport system substrate-binding protein
MRWDIIELLFFAYRDFVGDADQELEAFGFGRAHHRVMHFVYRYPGLKVADLLDVLRITKQSLGRVLKQLLDEGYIIQKTGNNDRRQRLLYATPKGEALVATFERDLDAIRERAAKRSWRPKVFFEEWYDPLISGIRWTEELVEIAGGQPIFPELADAGLAKDRIVTGEQVIARAPDVIIGSWCGKPVRKERITSRPGWQDVPAVRNSRIYEVKSTYILQPGPAALTEGVRRVHDVIRQAAGTM